MAAKRFKLENAFTTSPAVKKLKVKDASTSTLFRLNNDCLIKVFEWLSLEDTVNVAEAYKGMQSVADWTYKQKFKQITFHLHDRIDLALKHAGPTAKSLTLVLQRFDTRYLSRAKAHTLDGTENDLIKIRDTCKELQRLTLCQFDRKTFERNPSGSAMDRIEILTLFECSIAHDADFFRSFKNLKSLNLKQCSDIENIAVKKCFEKNPGLKSLTCDSEFLFDTELLLLLPHLQMLRLRYHSRQMKFNSLSKLQALRHFSLTCCQENVSDILTELTKVNILEELELFDVSVDFKTFKLIQSFENLQLLTVKANFGYPTITHALPAKLRTLKLSNFKIADSYLSALFKKLKHLDDLYFDGCELESNGESIFDFFGMAYLIFNQIENTDRRLTITLSSILDWQRLQEQEEDGKVVICNFESNPKVFKILFPGMD